MCRWHQAIFGSGLRTVMPYRRVYDEYRLPADCFKTWRGSTSSTSGLVTISGCRLSTYGDRAFPVAASRVWNSLPHHVTSAQSLSLFRTRLKTHLFRRSFPWLYCCACEVTLVIMDTLIVVFLLTYLPESAPHTTLDLWKYVYPLRTLKQRLCISIENGLRMTGVFPSSRS